MRIHHDVYNWQWKGYARAHRDRVNLLVHLVTVPLFWLGVLLAVSAIAFERTALALYLPLLWLIGMTAQGQGHRREAAEVERFLGPIDFIVRLLIEQFVTFPRYVLSGAFRRALVNAGRTGRAAGAQRPR